MDKTYNGYQLKIVMDPDVKGYRSFVAPGNAGSNFMYWEDAGSSSTMEGAEAKAVNYIDRYLVSGIIKPRGW